VIASNLIDGGTVGISVANFNEGGRLAAVTGNIIRNLTDASAPIRPNMPASASASPSRRMRRSPATSSRARRNGAC
jgi:putative cofactor-binding repeat protein